VRFANTPMINDCDVVVIGGGVTGCAAARELALRGVPVTLVEQHDLNTHASGRNAGSLHGQIQYAPFVELGEEWARRFAPALALLHESLSIWRGLGDELRTDLEVHVVGGLLVAATEAQLRAIERKAALEQSLGSPVELLSRTDLRDVAPYLADGLVGGMLCPLEGKANPLLAAPALARAAATAGCRLQLRTTTTSVRQADGAFAVETSAGTIHCRRVVDCTGVDVGRALGAELGVEGWPMQVAVTEPAPPLVRHLLYFAGGALTLKQAAVGSLLIGGGWPTRDLGGGRFGVDLEALGENLRLAVDVVPRIAGASLLRTWGGVCPGTADQLPIIGELVPGYVVAMFPYLGFTAGPVLGRVAAELALGDDKGRDLAPFSPLRF
jgi:glycine/D-amino acid oxidase-like deaminating enzyme